MFPRMFNRDKYLAYLELRKQYDKFLKSIREMRHCDWLIHKKLIEAGGIGDTVYILPARGGSSFQTAAMIARYLEEGRDVKLAYTLMGRGNGKWKTTDKYIEEQFKKTVLEWSEEEKRWNHFYDLMLSSFKKEREDWEPKPIIRTTSAIYDNPYLKHWLWDCWLKYGGPSKGVSDESEQIYRER